MHSNHSGQPDEKEQLLIIQQPLYYNQNQRSQHTTSSAYTVPNESQTSQLKLLPVNWAGFNQAQRLATGKQSPKRALLKQVNEGAISTDDYEPKPHKVPRINDNADREWYEYTAKEKNRAFVARTTPQRKKIIQDVSKCNTSAKRNQVIGMIRVKDYGFFKQNLIGTGSFSRVYRGFKVADQNQLVAIKEIEISDVGEKKIMQEINIHKSMCDSQFIVKLLDYHIERSKDICYLVLEYCQQGGLDKQFRTLSRNKSLQYFCQLLDAMQDLSSRNIIHRDLKLENILIKNNQIKLADFGFARSLPDNQLSVQSQKCGTPATMAPELIFSDYQKVNYTDKQDVWSLGVILHELIYKEHPFAQNKERMRLKQRVFVRNKDPIVESFLEGSLIFDSNLRMTLQEALNHPIYRSNCLKQSPQKHIWDNREIEPKKIIFQDTSEPTSQSISHRKPIVKEYQQPIQPFQQNKNDRKQCLFLLLLSIILYTLLVIRLAL